jgi:hypothetical protein
MLARVIAPMVARSAASINSTDEEHRSSNHPDWARVVSTRTKCQPNS